MFVDIWSVSVEHVAEPDIGLRVIACRLCVHAVSFLFAPRGLANGLKLSIKGGHAPSGWISIYDIWIRMHTLPPVAMTRYIRSIGRTAQ